MQTMERAIFSVSRRKEITNEKIRRRTKITAIAQKISEIKRIWKFLRAFFLTSGRLNTDMMLVIIYRSVTQDGLLVHTRTPVEA